MWASAPHESALSLVALPLNLAWAEFKHQWLEQRGSSNVVLTLRREGIPKQPVHYHSRHMERGIRDSSDSSLLALLPLLDGHRGITQERDDYIGRQIAV